MHRHCRIGRRLVGLGVALVVAGMVMPPVGADEWPQWMGPRRDNIWREDGSARTFPAGGPRVLWRVPVAGGYAGAAVAGGRVFVTDYVTDADVKVSNFDRKTSTGKERVLCLDEATG